MVTIVKDTPITYITLQPITTQCKTLLRWNTLQRTCINRSAKIMHQKKNCHTLSYTVTQCSTLKDIATHCHNLQYTAINKHQYKLKSNVSTKLKRIPLTITQKKTYTQTHTHRKISHTSIQYAYPEVKCRGLCEFLCVCVFCCLNVSVCVRVCFCLFLSFCISVLLCVFMSLCMYFYMHVCMCVCMCV